jgi:predicted permease
MWWHRVAAKRRQAQQDVDDELQSHIDARVEYLVAHGLSEEQARAEAVRRFGDLEAGRARLYQQAERRRPRLRLGDYLHDLAQDVRYVGRSLWHAPAFAIGVVATLALGLGVNAAVFRVADVVLFRAPGGVARPQDVRWLESSITIGRGTPSAATLFSYRDAAAITHTDGVDAAMYVTRSANDAAGRALTVNYVDGRYFDMLHVAPAIGRAFTADEVAPGRGAPAAIVTDAYWRLALNRAPLSDAPRIKVGDQDLPIVGVLPRAFVGVDLNPTDVFLPMGLGQFGRGFMNGVEIPWYQTDMMRAIRVLCRVPSISATEQTTARLSATLKANSPVADADYVRKAVLHPIVPIGNAAQTKTANGVITQLTILAAVVLGIAAANAINLLLARGLRRQREIAIRLAIGGGRARVARLLLIEGLVVSAVSGVAAMCATVWVSESLRRLLYPDARWSVASLDVRALVISALVTLGVGIIVGLVPVWQFTTPDLVTGLKNAATTGARTKFTRASLVALQTALSLTLVVTTALVVQSLIRLNRVPLGFDPSGLVTASIDPQQVLTDQAAGTMTATMLAERLASTPDGAVGSVATATSVPFGAMTVRTIRVIGSSYVPDPSEPGARWAGVSDNYFTVMRTRVVWGRGFSPNDTAGSEPVTVINETMARAYFNGQIPSGGCIMPSGQACMRIVGIVEDIRDTPNADDPPQRYYAPLRQSADLTPAYLSRVGGAIVRTTPDRARDAAARMRSLVPASQRATVEVISDRVNLALRPWLVATWLFSALGVLAMLLACVGVYSVVNYLALERLNELGIRVVLGARPVDILRIVFQEGFRMAATGGVVGVIASVIAGRYLRALLFGVSRFDPTTYAVALLLLGAASAIAILPAAQRASRVDPLVICRKE